MNSILSDSLTWDEAEDLADAKSGETIELHEERQRVWWPDASGIAPSSEEISDTALGTAPSEEMTDCDFTDMFQLRPIEAINTLLLFVELSLVSSDQATKWLFPFFVKVHGELREQMHKALLDLEEPGAILHLALREYDRFGNAERLVLAASLLEAMGAHAFPALRAVARSGRAECDFFIHAITHLNGVSAHDRLEALANMARNPHADVRYSLTEALRFFPPQDALPLLRLLANDEEEDIAGEAREYLEAVGLTP